MKNIFQSIFILFTFAIFFGACSNFSGPDLSKVENTILKKLNKNSSGLMLNLDISNIEVINDSTFIAIHSFTNSVLKKEMKITNQYDLNSELSKIKKQKQVKMEILSNDEWIESKP